MVRIFSTLMLAFGLLAYMPLIASANGWDGSRHDRFDKRHGGKEHVGRQRGQKVGRHHGPSAAVPELDPNAAGAALALLAGGALALGSRRRRAAV